MAHKSPLCTLHSRLVCNDPKIRENKLKLKKSSNWKREQTNIVTDIATLWLTWPRGPSQWKSRIQETLSLSIDADSSTNTIFFLGGGIFDQKSLGHQEVGVLDCHRQTHRHTDMPTSRLNQPRGQFSESIDNEESHFNKFRCVPALCWLNLFKLFSSSLNWPLRWFSL